MQSLWFVLADWVVRAYDFESKSSLKTSHQSTLFIYLILDE
jgi:hypothetical protein